jgi:hypothetical protein
VIARRALLVCASVALVGAASDQMPKDRQQAAQIYRPNIGKRGVQKLMEGDDALVVPLIWTRAATVGRGVDVSAGDRRDFISQGDVLPEEFIASAQGSADGFIAYCMPRKAKERSVDRMNGHAGGLILARSLMRSMNDAQFCLVDRDKDGQADASILVGAGWGPQRSLRPIAPVPLTIANDVQISAHDDLVRISFRDAGKSGPSFEFEVRQQGDDRSFSTWGGQRSILSYKAAKGWPQRVTIAGATFVITGYDPVAKTVTVEWPEDVDRNVRIDISDDVTYVPR